MLHVTKKYGKKTRPQQDEPVIGLRVECIHVMHPSIMTLYGYKHLTSRLNIWDRVERRDASGVHAQWSKSAITNRGPGWYHHKRVWHSGRRARLLNTWRP